LFRDCFEFFARLREIDRVDFGCAVDEAAFSYAEADSAVCSGDCERMRC
jgi:hypothetical protein